MLTRVILLTIAIGYTSAIVCQQNYCDTARCAVTEASQCDASSSQYVPRSTFCGCCGQCVPYVPAGGSCNLLPPLILGGAPIVRSSCEPGTKCINYICARL